MGEASGPVGIEALGQVSVNVKQLPNAVPFYRDVLELPLELETPGMAFFRCGATRLMLSVPGAGEFDHPGSVLYFTVRDIEASHAALAARGVSFLRPPHCIARLGERDLYMAFFRDPEGNTLAL
nr:VOC family protein [Acidobacteriota bacterium]MCU0254962.1 VOC family protein [Acidobacteriota bacterium]